jgi:hypothetical protein
MTFVPAHAGHWLAELMYVAPVVAIVGWIGVRSILDRRAEAREEAAGGPGGPPDQDSRSSSAMS